MPEMYQIYQHWDPLKVCIVGRAYPPEFFSWIKNSNTRTKFEKMVEETEEDYQNLIRLLQDRFAVRVVRPKLPEDLSVLCIGSKWVQPPTAPRDYFLMIQDKFYIPRVPNASHAWAVFYRQNKKLDWDDYKSPREFSSAMPEVAKEVLDKFEFFNIIDQQHLNAKFKFYEDIFTEIECHGNDIVYTDLDFINGCFVSRLGKDLFFATQDYHDDKQKILDQVRHLFPSTRNHVVNAGGHGDAVYCPVTPGLIISLNDVTTYQDTFPGWEVVYLPPSDYAHMRRFEHSMKCNKGRWFMPGFESDTELQNTVDYYFNEWVGQVSETVFDVNILIVNPTNIVVSAHNDLVEQACNRHGITVHVVSFRHKYFWDCGIHCITNDIDRQGHLQDIFDPT